MDVLVMAGRQREASRIGTGARVEGDVHGIRGGERGCIGALGRLGCGEVGAIGRKELIVAKERFGRSIRHGKAGMDRLFSLRCAVGDAGGIVRRLPDRVPSLAGIAHGEVEGSLGGRRRTAAGSRAWLGTGLWRGKTWEMAAWAGVPRAGCGRRCAKGGDAGNLNEADGPAESGERPGGPDVLAELEVGVGAKIPGGGGCLDSAL
ncbi:hypothetical protein L1887_53702 [Cichorium endivia]|nr:hypothetical protein L1887_53702 [Cichorium endivia]